MPDAIVEKDVCGLVLSVDVFVDYILFSERGAERLFLAGEQRASGGRRGPHRRLPRPPGAREVDGKIEKDGLAPLAAMEADQACCVDDAVDLVPVAFHTQALPEMLRLEEYFER